MFITCVEVHVHRSICLKIIIYNFLLNFAARLYIVQNHITETISSSSNTKGGNVVLANTNVNFVCFAIRNDLFLPICPGYLAIAARETLRRWQLPLFCGEIWLPQIIPESFFRCFRGGLSLCMNTLRRISDLIRKHLFEHWIQLGTK